MIAFFKRLINSNDPTSSKRFVGLLGSVSLITVMFIERSDSTINAVLILCLGCFAINGAERITNLLKK